MVNVYVSGLPLSWLEIRVFEVHVPETIVISISKLFPVADKVVCPPSPVNVYHTPKLDANPPPPGAVSETEFTVVPAKLDVAQGKEVAAEQLSFDGGGMVVVNVLLPAQED